MLVNKILCAQLYSICCDAALFLILKKMLNVTGPVLNLSVFLFISFIGKNPAFCNDEVLQSIGFIPSIFCTD